MRIHPVVVTISAVLTVLIAWWVFTRNMDFLEPPSPEKLAEIRAESKAAIPLAKNPPNPTVDPPSAPVAQLVTPKNPITPPSPSTLDLGDLSTPPVLDSYSNRVPDGPKVLFQLARALEASGAFQRALLCYERIIDLSTADPTQIEAAITEITRLRQSLANWNTDPIKAIPITINIGTGPRFEDELPKIIEDVQRELRNASSGILKFSTNLHIGETIEDGNSPTPLAIWLTNGEEPTQSTDVLSFTSNDPETLFPEILKTIFNLVRSTLTKGTSYNPAPEASEDPVKSLNSHITRLLWKEFGTLISSPPPATPTSR